MKTLGHILIILAVFALVMGITYVVVSRGNSSASGIIPRSGSGNEQFSSTPGATPGFANGQSLQFPGRDRNEFHGGRGGGGLLFGAIKNIAIIGIIVAVIVLPKSWMQKRKRTAQAAVG